MKLAPFLERDRLEAGCDEAGRGCLAGPVCAAAVILPPDFHHPLLNDSKQMREKDRDVLRPIIEQEAISWQVAFLSPEVIDDINILNASIRAMHVAIEGLATEPEFLLIDGNRFHAYNEIPHACMIKGDSRFASIAAASVLAKTYRDEYMLALSQSFPAYHWESNKGYPTKAHREAIIKNGITPHHRKSFRLLPEVEQKVLFEE
jgi:ribonuclease HII